MITEKDPSPHFDVAQQPTAREPESLILMDKSLEQFKKALKKYYNFYWRSEK